MKIAGIESLDLPTAHGPTGSAVYSRFQLAMGDNLSSLSSITKRNKGNMAFAAKFTKLIIYNDK